MKKILLNIVLILSLPVFYFIAFSGFKDKEETKTTAVSISSDTVTKSFINLIFTDTYFGSPLHGHDPNDLRSIENNILNFRDSLHFNSVHVYGYGDLGGGFDDSISYYSSYVNGLITTVNTAGLSGFFGRNKIEQLSYGQRLIYEIGSSNVSRINSGFSYDSIMSNTYETDTSRTVLHAKPYPISGYNPAGWLCKDIYENLQHGDLINFNQADTLEWKIKPVMRIKATDYNVNSTIPVIAIVTKNYSGKRIDSAIIRVNNFRDGNGNYSGNYIENYQFLDGPNSDSLKISGSRELSSGLSNGMIDSNWTEWKDSCKVDFKVWWFGDVEVWFDKMIVDDHWGDKLFSTEMDCKIRDGATMGNYHELLKRIRNDKNIRSSNYPCINYVFNKMYNYIYPVQFAQAR